MGTPRSTLSPTNDLVFRMSFSARENMDGRAAGDSRRPPFSDRRSIHVIELPKRRRGVVSSADADLLPWAQFLASETDEEVSEARMSNPVIEKTNRALEELSSNPETRLRALEREDELRLWEVELQAQFEHGLQEGRVEGRAEGRVEGRAEGRVEANAVTLLRLLRAKFGALDASTEARVRAASEAELERWLLAVLSAPDVASVFA
ncbi:PD-(D/E)XK nuclease family transposase [Myxococcota bacterium]|nr:PD-(D/E)XK nuclease family transposase [Myxococcota bacterium]